MFYNLRLSARWVYWLCIAAFFGFGVSRLPSLVRLYWRSVHLCGLPAAPGIFHFFILICEKPGRRTPGRSERGGARRIIRWTML